MLLKSISHIFQVRNCEHSLPFIRRNVPIAFDCTIYDLIHIRSLKIFFRGILPLCIGWCVGPVKVIDFVSIVACKFYVSNIPLIIVDVAQPDNKAQFVYVQMLCLLTGVCALIGRLQSGHHIGIVWKIKYSACYAFLVIIKKNRKVFFLLFMRNLVETVQIRSCNLVSFMRMRKAQWASRGNYNFFSSL